MTEDGNGGADDEILRCAQNDKAKATATERFFVAYAPQNDRVTAEARIYGEGKANDKVDGNDEESQGRQLDG